VRSFVALGLRPTHRSAEVASDGPGLPATTSETTRPVKITSLSLLVPIVDGDLEFQQPMQEYQFITLANPPLFSAGVSLGLPLSVPAASISTCVPTAPATATVDLQPPAAVQMMMMPQSGTAVELDGPPMSIHAPSDGRLEQPEESQPSAVTVEKMTNNEPVEFAKEPSSRARAAAKPASGGRRHGPSSSSRRQLASRCRSPSARSSRPSRDAEPDRRSGRVTLSMDQYRELMRARRPLK